MVTSTENRWSRARYPLASHGKQQYPASNPPQQETPTKDVAQLTKYSDVKDSIPWYHAVTDLREKPVLQRCPFDSLASRVDTSDMPASDGSLTAVSWSRRSLSPPPEDSIDAQDELGNSNIQTFSVAARPSNASQESVGQQSTESNVESRPSSAGSERLSNDEQSPGNTVKRARTLRRTPRSRRIVAPIPASEVGLPGYSARKAADADESPNLLSGPWRKLSYPLHATTDTHSADPAVELAEPAQDSRATLHDEDLGDAESGSRTLEDRSDDHLQSAEDAKDLSVQDKSHANPNASNGKVQANQSSEVRVGKFSSKRGYPLQSPVSHVNLRSSPSPPPSPRNDTDQHAVNFIEEEIQEETSLPSRRIYRRPVYPLQVPSDGFTLDLQAKISPPPTPKEQANVLPVPQALNSAVTKGEGKPWGFAELGSPQSAMGANVRDRDLQKYPVQLPIAAVDTAPASVDTTIDVSKEDSPQAAVTAKMSSTQKPKSLKRKIYPLQSPASVMDLKSQESQKDFVTKEVEAILEETKNSEPDNHGNPSAHDAREVEEAPKRRGYPLQSRTRGSSLSTVPSSIEAPAKVAENREDPGIEAIEPSEAPQRVYRRQRYPLHNTNQAKQSQTQDKAPSRTPGALKEPETKTAKVVQEDTTESNNDKPSLWKRSAAMALDSHMNPAGRRQSTFLLNAERPSNPHQVARPEPQRPASSVPTISVTPGSPERETPPGDRHKGREDELAKKVLSHWRRQVYPVQDPTKAAPFPRSPTPQPSAESLRDKKEEKIHLPKNLTAVKDANAPPQKGRTLVVCLDGTGDKFDDDNSNIVHIVSALKKDDPNQVTYYQAGIGTYGEGGLSGGFTAAMDMAVGAGLGLHVRDAYHFLMHSYKEGDRICIFGFSRGAYTARCVAGMIHKVGLLPPRNIQQIAFAYEFYANDSPEGWKQSRDFKKTFSIDVNVHFLGCFDSVASVGFIPRTLPLSTTPTNKPRYFRHAMALDERRAKFKVARHKTLKLQDIKENRTQVSATAHWLHTLLPFYRDQNDAPPEYHNLARFRDTHHPNVTDEEYERLTAADDNFDSDVLEVWFAGAHADVGGGAVANTQRHKLAQIPLRWMIRQAFECDTGILFHTKALAEFGLDVHTLWPKYERLKAPQHGPPPSIVEKYESELPPRQIRRSKLKSVEDDFYHLEHPTDEDWTPEQIEDYYDAMSPMNDQLLQAPNWWILEFWPVQIKLPKAPGEVDIIVGMNMGRYRAAEEPQPLMHWTVRHRMAETGYKLGVRTAPQVTWKEVV